MKYFKKMPVCISCGERRYNLGYAAKTRKHLRLAETTVVEG
jgi:hypothetical protein